MSEHFCMSRTISFWPVNRTEKRRCCWREDGKLDREQCDEDVHQNSRDAKVCDNHSIAWVGLPKKKKDALKAAADLKSVPIELRRRRKKESTN